MLTWRTPKYSGPERRKGPRWRPRPFRVLLTLLGLAVAGYALAVVWLLVQESRIVSQAGSAPATGRPPFPYQQVDIPRTDGAAQFAWVIPSGAADVDPWILYLHGNATTIASTVNISHYRLLRDLGLTVVAPEYRGFGGLDGRPTEASLYADARAAYDYVRVTRGIAPSRILVYGWSLGSAMAVEMATSEPFPAVVLEAAPASLADLTQQRYPFFPLRPLMPNRFDSIRRIARVSSPILFLHSPDDEVVPIEQGRQLFAGGRGGNTFVEISGGHFDAIDIDAAAIARTIRAFLMRHGVQVQAAAGAQP